MKKNILMAAAALLALCACQPKSKPGDGAAAGTLPYGITQQEVEGMRLTTIQDNATEKAHPNRLFYGVDNADSLLVDSLSPGGEVPSSIHCFLVEKEGKRILFDAGLGAARGGKMLERLDSIGVKPEEVDLVVLTHFHSDHIGGMLQGDTLPVFTRAQVYAPQAECDYWTGRGNELTLRLYAAYGERIHNFAPGDTLPLGIVPLEAPGHTPGHTAYRMARLLIIGDLIHGAALQLEHPEICASYDMDRPQAVASRRQLIKYARQEQLVVAGMHLPGNGVLLR